MINFLKSTELDFNLLWVLPATHYPELDMLKKMDWWMDGWMKSSFNADTEPHTEWKLYSKWKTITEKTKPHNRLLTVVFWSIVLWLMSPAPASLPYILWDQNQRAYCLFVFIYIYLVRFREVNYLDRLKESYCFRVKSGYQCTIQQQDSESLSWRKLSREIALMWTRHVSRYR